MVVEGGQLVKLMAAVGLELVERDGEHDGPERPDCARCAGWGWACRRGPDEEEPVEKHGKHQM